MRSISPQALAAALILLTGCIAPRPESEGSVEEFERLLEESGGETVVAEDASTEPLEEPVAEAQTPEELDAEEAARVLEEIQEAYAEPEEETFEEPEESPYLRFGERILVREQGDATFVIKPYTLPNGRPQKIVELLKAMAPFTTREHKEDQALDAGFVDYQILANFDEEYYADFNQFTQKGPGNTQKVPVSDVLVVTAIPDLLEEFEDFLDLFAGGGVPQIELEAKIIEISESDSLDIGIGNGLFEFGTTNFVQSFGASLPNFSESTEALLTLGAVQDEVAFTAILEAVKNWQNVSVESRPKTVVRSGGVAHIDTTTSIPYVEVTSINQNGNYNLNVKYQPVGTQLWISPRRVGSTTLALDVKLQGSQRIGSEVLVVDASGTPIEVPTIATRQAKTVVHLQPGQTLVIGGLTQERKEEIQAKIPILGDIPLLGALFRSTYEITEKQHVIFAISPRIIQYSDFESDL